jgi:hypothetical protein
MENIFIEFGGSVAVEGNLHVTNNGYVIANNIVLANGEFIANGSPGEIGQVFTSNGSSGYWANAISGNGSGFATVKSTGQANVVVNPANTVLNIEAANAILISTDNTTKTVTVSIQQNVNTSANVNFNNINVGNSLINATVNSTAFALNGVPISSGPSFGVIESPGQANVLALTSNSVLNISSANGIVIGTDDTSKTVSISAQQNINTTANVTFNSISDGIVTINSTAISIGSNLVANSSYLLVGNSSINVTINSTGFAVNGVPIVTPITATIGFTVDGGASTPSTGIKARIQVPYSGTIISWTLLADQSGSTQVTIKKSTYTNYPTTVSIVASAPPTLSSQRKNTDSTLSGWTTTFSAGDIFELTLDSVTSCKQITLLLKAIRS